MRQESYVEFERHWKVHSHVFLEIVFEVGVPAQIFTVVTNCLPKLTRLVLVDFFVSEAILMLRYLPRVMISLYSMRPYILSAIPCVKLWSMG